MLAAPCEIGFDHLAWIAKEVSLPSMHLSSFLLLLALAAVVGCDGAQDVDDAQQRLVGRWLRDDEEDGAHVRRVLVLQAGGRFAETSKATKVTKATEATGAAKAEQGDAVLAQHAHSGNWLFDGTNLKRRYTLRDC